MRGKWIFLLGVLGLLAAFSTVASAATDVENVTVNAVVPSAISITSIPSEITLDVNIGSQTTTSMTMDVKSNTTWSLTVYKDADLTSAGDTIPTDRLVYSSSSTSGSGVGDTQFATTPGSNVVTGGGTTGETPATVTVNYKLTANFDDDQGAYVATHTYTAAAP